MHKYSNTLTISPVIVKNGLMVLSGYAIQLFVDSGFLVVRDGFGRQRRESKFSKATCRIKRVVVLGNKGSITFAAFAWLYGIKAAFIQIGWNGEVYNATVTRKDDVLLRRKQYSAVNNDTGLDITRYVIREKVIGQTAVIKEIFPNEVYPYDDTYRLSEFLELLTIKTEYANTIDELIGIESLAANAYWTVIGKFPLNYIQADEDKIPEHWKIFGARHSLLQRKANRNATNPANAMLNYLYALLYAETRIKMLQAGLDTWAGIFHTDSLYRESFVYDVMDAGRSKVDKWLLDFIQNNTFPKKYFRETENGHVRLNLHLSPMLAATISEWGNAIDPAVNRVKAILKNGK